MTVYLFTGTPGSGKSLHMSKLIYWHVRMKRPVVANFEINGELFKDASSFSFIANEELSPDVLGEYAERYFSEHAFREGAIRLFIDEAQIIFGNRDWRAADRADWIRFFTQHRKLGYDVYIIAQNHEMIDKQIRSLVEYEVMHRKVNNVGWVGKLFAVCALGHPVVCAVTRWYGMKMRLSSEWLLGTSKYYRLYDTLKVFER